MLEKKKSILHEKTMHIDSLFYIIFNSLTYWLLLNCTLMKYTLYMKNQCLYLNTGKLIHPKVLKIILRSQSPLSPTLKTKDPEQPSHGILINKHAALTYAL